MNLVNLIKAKVAIDEIKKQDPEKLGVQVADMLDKIMDDSCGKKSQDIQNVMINFVNKFSMSFSKRLLEN